MTLLLIYVNHLLPEVSLMRCPVPYRIEILSYKKQKQHQL